MGKNLTGFASAVIVAVIAVAVAVYYLIPGISHPRFMGGGATTGPAKAVAIFFFVIALGAVIVAVVMRPRKHEA